MNVTFQSGSNLEFLTPVTDQESRLDDEDEIDDATTDGAELTDRRTVTIIEPATDEYYGSETATIDYPADGGVSVKMAEAQEALEAIRDELEEEERQRTAERADQEQMDLDEVYAALQTPLGVTKEDLVSVIGTQQPLEERTAPAPPRLSPRPTVQSQSLSFLASWQPSKEAERPVTVPVRRERDEKSVHHFCTAGDAYQLPEELRGVMRMYHTPGKYDQGSEFGDQRRGARTATTFGARDTPFVSAASLASDSGHAQTSHDQERLAQAAARVMEEADKLRPGKEDVQEWRDRSESALAQMDLDLELKGQKMELKDDDSRFYWSPAPAKLDLAPRYVKQRLFPQYRGTLGMGYDSDFLAEMENENSSDEEGDEVQRIDSINFYKGHQLASRKCASSEDLTIYQRARHEREKHGARTSSTPTPREPATPSSLSKSNTSLDLKTSASDEGRALFDENRKQKPSTQFYGLGKKPDPIITPTFVRRRTYSAPAVYDEGDSLQIPEDFHSAMDELHRQHESLKRYWEEKGEESEEEEPKVEGTIQPTSDDIIEDIMAEIPEAEKKDYELTINQKIQLRDQKKTPAELAIEAGRKYVILPKKKKKGKPVDPARLRAIDEFLNEEPRRLERRESYRRLNPPLPDRMYRVPAQLRGVNRRGSVPDFLDFEKYADKLEAPRFKDHVECREWVRDIWNGWFDELYPPEEESEDSDDAVEHVQQETSNVTDENGEKKKQEEIIVELAEEIEPVFDDDEDDREVIIKLLQEEVSELTKQIDSAKSPNPFHICRRGAIYKKLGKLRLAMEDLDWCLEVEPMLLDAYWHRHLLYMMQNKNKAALEDLNFLLKHNKNHAKAYKSRAELYRSTGEITLSIMNYSSAIKLNPDDDESYFKRAEMYEARGDQLLALEDYSKTTKLQPHRTDALFKHTQFHFENKTWQPAIAGFTEILKQEPSNSEARTLRGRAFAQLGQHHAAVQDFSAAVHLDPNNAVAFYHRACLLRKCHPQRALRDFSLSLLIDDSEDNILSYLHRGILYYEMERLEDAIADFEAVTLLNKDNACAHCNLGLIYYHTESYHRAVKKFSTAVMVDPTYLRAYLCRAEAYIKLHDLKSALLDLTRAIYLQPDIPHLYMHRGYLLLQLGHLDLAAYCIRNAACMNYDVSSQSATQQAVVQAFLKNYDRVIEILRTATVHKPTSAMQVLLGKMLMKAKMYEEAIKCFDSALWTMKPQHERLPWPKDAAEVNYLRGVSYIELGNYQGANEALNQAISINGKLADAYYQRGLVRMRLKHSKGVQDFNRALALNPKSFQAFLSRAAFYGMKQQYSKAVLNCNEAIRLQPISVRAYLYRGSLKYHLKAYDLAIKDLSTAILLDNKCYLAYFNRAICYHDNKEFLKALTDYGIVLLLGESLKVKVLVNRGLLYYEFKDYGNALQDFLAAVELSPNDKNLHHTVGLCYHRLNRLDEAIRCFTKALDLSPFFLDAYIGRGNAFMDFATKTGLDCSKRDYEHCILLDPSYLPARVNLAYNLQMRGKFMQAWMQFSASLSINPKFVPALEGRAIISLQMQNTFGAIQDMTAALKVSATAELYTNRGVVNQYMGDKVNAMRDYQKALTLDATFSLAYFNAANIYFHSRQFTQAKDYYDKALANNTKDESAYLNRAITKVMLKDVDGALEDFKRAVRLSPRAAHIYFNRANLYSSLTKYQEAERDYTKAFHNFSIGDFGLDTPTYFDLVELLAGEFANAIESTIS